MGNEALLEAFRHNSWATRRLLESCKALSEEQLSAATTGTFGGILATFNHFVLADGRYVLQLAGSAPAWAVNREANADLDRLEERANETAGLWERFLSEPVDAERVIVVDEGTREVRAGIFVAQALHHGNAHREQICAIMTGLGMEPPDVQAWEYAWATGRIWDRTTDH